MVRFDHAYCLLFCRLYCTVLAMAAAILQPQLWRPERRRLCHLPNESQLVDNERRLAGEKVLRCWRFTGGKFPRGLLV